MANKVFISFRFSDGNDYKQKLEQKFEELDYVINKSENEDRSDMSEATIQKYLYEKLRDTSITIVILTPDAIDYKKDFLGYIDDWLYDELRYSLENRVGNLTNGVITLYVPESKSTVIYNETEKVTTIADFDNLVRKNMFNIKDEYKHCQTPTYYDSLKDNYISLIDFDKFYENPNIYIDSAIEKRNRLEEFEIVKRM